jgi:hypothetical protein
MTYIESFLQVGTQRLYSYFMVSKTKTKLIPDKGCPVWQLTKLLWGKN